jgi:4-amino-4-deoxy-L-arabinose transferase-like glycosyltransferase
MLQNPLRVSFLLPALIIIGVAATVFCTAPKSDDFWWTDSPSLALNGELILDYVESGFHQSPMAFANEWFRRYPAINISLYPPIFPIAEAIAYSLFGFSHAAAQGTVAAFTLVAAFGFYRVMRTALGPLEAAGGVLVLFAVPIVLLWSRQVMMELPSLAFLLLATSFFLYYQASRQTRDLYLATLLMLAAVYTRQTAIFAAPAFAIALVVSDGWAKLRDRTVWIAAAMGLIALLPLAVFTLIAAHQVIDIALGAGIAAPAAGIAASATFEQVRAYGLALPEIIGLPVLIASVCYALFVAFRGWQSPAERRLAVLMLAWFCCDFVFVSATVHFEARYAVALGVPCAAAGVMLIARLSGRWAGAGVVPCLAAALFIVSLGTNGVSRMSGYDKVAAYVLDHSKQDDVVWFQAKQSKNFVFSLRSHLPTPKVYVLRAEKLLVDYHIVRETGISDRGWTTDMLHDFVERNGVSMVVLEPDFWADLPSMARMQDYIRSAHFRQVAEFPITADDPSQRTTIEIFVKQTPGSDPSTGLPLAKPDIH